LVKIIPKKLEKEWRKKGKYLGKNNHMFGKKLSEETKTKMSKSNGTVVEVPLLCLLNG
jgi:hypothetical protein